MSQFCENCGAPLPDDAKFCEACGARVIPLEGTEKTPYKRRSSVPETAGNRRSEASSFSRGSSGAGGFPKIVLAGIVVILAAVTGVFALRGGKKKDDQGENIAAQVTTEAAETVETSDAAETVEASETAPETADAVDQTAAEYTESRTEAPLQEFPAVTGGEWIQIASVWFYQKDGELVKSSWIDDKGVYYYVDDSGYMLSDAFTPDGYYVGADGSYDPGAPQNQGGGASSAAGTPAGEAMAAIAEKLSTDEVAGATEFDWFMDYVNQSGYGMAQVITDPARASRITDVQEALNGGWKAFIFTEKGVYGSDVERYLNANIDVFGGRFNITLNWKYLMEPNGGGTIEETGSTTYRGTYDDLEGTATAQTSDSRIDFDGFFLSADGKAEYAVGTFRWISGEIDRIGLMRSAR